MNAGAHRSCPQEIAKFVLDKEAKCTYKTNEGKSIGPVFVLRREISTYGLKKKREE